MVVAVAYSGGDTDLPFEHHVYRETTVHSGCRLHIALKKSTNVYFSHFPKSVLNGQFHREMLLKIG